MVYSGSDVRHRESAPLRLPQSEIDELVSRRPLCCSHFDAFRFFAPDTVPLNRFTPTLLTREDHEHVSSIIGDATNSEEYVPTTTPTIRANINPLITSPPNRKITNRTKNVVNDVLTVLLNVL